MGTHPIFESDFDCLTDRNRAQKWTRTNRFIAATQVGLHKFE